MDRKWLAPYLIYACALGTLDACAVEGAGDEATETGDETGGEASHEQEFPVRADLIDDIREAIGGEGETGGETEGTEGTKGGGGLTGGITESGIPEHGDPPLILSDSLGPYRVDSYGLINGTVYYPTDAKGPFVGLALCGGFLNSGFEMTDWGWFYASWGIVTVITGTFPLDLPATRGALLGGSIEELKGENESPTSPLYNQMSGRYGTSGYSMGGGGTTIASASDWDLNVSIGMAPWLPTGFGVQTPTLLMCGDIDVVAPCDMAEAAYWEISETVPKMMVVIGGVSHLGWFGPDAGWGVGGAYGLAFAKVYLEGDERWKSALLGLSGSVTTNIF